MTSPRSSFSVPGRATTRGGERAAARQGCADKSPYHPLRETVATVDGRKLDDGSGSLTFPHPAPGLRGTVPVAANEQDKT